MIGTEIQAAIIAGSTLYTVGPSTSSKVPIFIGKTPPNQSGTVVSIYESGGVGPLYTHAGMSVRRPGIQLLVRSTAGGTARTHADRIFGILGTIANSTDFISITPSQDPIDLGNDPDNRHLMSINLIIERPSS